MFTIDAQKLEEMLSKAKLGEGGGWRGRTEGLLKAVDRQGAFKPAT